LRKYNAINSNIERDDKLNTFIGKTVVFIPVRGGSKSIPFKNIKQFMGKPLVFWSIDAAENSIQVDKIIVSTDSDAIRTTLSNSNASKLLVINRSLEVSTDTASTESTLLEFALNYDFEYVILVQATSPLITQEDIDNGFEKFILGGYDSLLSVVKQKRFIWNTIDEVAFPMNYNPLSRPRRQDFDGYFVENGAFYITTRKQLLKSQCRISGKIGIYEMDEATYFEIDEPADWEIMEMIQKNKLTRSNSVTSRLKKIKCVLTDCDGVLTDGGMYYSESGEELKKFNTKDGKGMELLKKSGLITGIITGENSQSVLRRAKKLNLDEVYIGVKNKMEIIDEICSKYTLTYDEIAYLGDDINDIEVISNVGFGCSVSDAINAVKIQSIFTTSLKGGYGAFREFADYILVHRK
jgi:YrbI family 3-deoxy-D-manno-octulosonate 8-phosphate phosphatase